MLKILSNYNEKNDALTVKFKFSVGDFVEVPLKIKKSDPKSLRSSGKIIRRVVGLYKIVYYEVEWRDKSGTYLGKSYQREASLEYPLSMFYLFLVLV